MHIHMHYINSIHSCSMLASNTHASHQQPSLLLICFCSQQLQTNTGKRSQAGNWQSSRAGTANVPRHGSGKCSQAGNRTRRRPQAGDSGCSQAGNCWHCAKKFSNDLPPTEVPLHRQPGACCVTSLIACLLTGQRAVVKKGISIDVLFLQTRQKKDTNVLTGSSSGR